TIKQSRRIDGREASPSEPSPQALRQLRLLVVWESNAWRRRLLGVSNGDDVAPLLRDVQLVLHFTGPGRQLQRECEMGMVLVANDRVDAFTGRPSRSQMPFGACFSRLRDAIEFALDVIRIVRGRLLD